MVFPVLRARLFRQSGISLSNDPRLWTRAELAKVELRHAALRFGDSGPILKMGLRRCSSPQAGKVTAPLDGIREPGSIPMPLHSGAVPLEA